MQFNKRYNVLQFNIVDLFLKTPLIAMGCNVVQHKTMHSNSSIALIFTKACTKGKKLSQFMENFENQVSSHE